LRGAVPASMRRSLNVKADVAAVLVSAQQFALSRRRRSGAKPLHRGAERRAAPRRASISEPERSCIMALETPGRRPHSPFHRFRASIRTLNGPLRGPGASWGSIESPRFGTVVTNLGVFGCCHLKSDLMDQQIRRSHPNKAVDVLVWQGF